jgi:two-component system phosphate regulon response regulator OmpR
MPMMHPFRTPAPEPAVTRRLLLIDDDSRLTDMVGDYLRRNGYDVDTAGSLAAGASASKQGGYDACCWT